LAARSYGRKHNSTIEEGLTVKNRDRFADDLTPKS
jgi:hypothetical protein